MKIKKIIALSILCILVVAIGLKAKEIVEQKYYLTLVNYNILKKCYTPHPFIMEIFDQEGFNYKEYDQKTTSESLIKLENTKAQTIPKIPTIFHKVYVATKNSNKKLEPFYIEELKLNFNKLNKLNISWRHIIWTNKAELFAEVSDIKNVEIRSFSEFNDSPYYNILLDIIHQGDNLKPYLAHASDLFRLMILQKFGGVYSDVDAEIYKPEALLELMKKFDFIGVRETLREFSYHINGFIATKANHPILNDALEKFVRNYNAEQKDINIPEYIKFPCTIYDKILLSGPLLLTVSYFAKNNIDGNNDIILPSWMGMNKEFARLKNNNCNLSKITEDSFKEIDNNLNVLLEEFIKNPKLKKWQYTCNLNKPALQNIYYTIKDIDKYDIIVGDPACGSWITNENHEKAFYFNFNN